MTTFRVEPFDLGDGEMAVRLLITKPDKPAFLYDYIADVFSDEDIARHRERAEKCDI